MKKLDVLQSTTAVNTEVFGLKTSGNIKAGYVADIVVVNGDLIKDIKTVTQTILLMKDGVIYKKP